MECAFMYRSDGHNIVLCWPLTGRWGAISDCEKYLYKDRRQWARFRWVFQLVLGSVTLSTENEAL